MNDTLEPRKTKERSPIFPFITLEAALDRARQFYNEEKRGSAPFRVTAGHWRYSPNSSGASQTASALKNYGLMVDDGSGINRKLKLTDLALRILLDNRPDDTERKRYMRQAALTPKVAADIFQKWPNEMPSEATLNHYLVLELGFSQSNALKTSAIIQSNQLLTNSYEGDILSPNYKIESIEQEPSYPMEQQTVDEQLIPKAIELRSATTRTERVIDPNGLDVLLQFSGEPTIASYEFIKGYIELRIKALGGSSVTRKKDKL